MTHHKHAHEDHGLEILKSVSANEITRPLAGASCAVPGVRECLDLFSGEVLSCLGIIQEMQAELESAIVLTGTHRDDDKIYSHERHGYLIHYTFLRQSPQIAALAEECGNMEYWSVSAARSSAHLDATSPPLGGKH